MFRCGADDGERCDSFEKEVEVTENLPNEIIRKVIVKKHMSKWSPQDRIDVKKSVTNEIAHLIIQFLLRKDISGLKK